ncbi:hypothetical protein [Deinococcus sp. 12RED42]|nr:hypothetical protein [Deinococcus sp. 12RED42]MCD0166802.1 hypothetical protein [Deinococcus sp. 12RED42]
MEALLVQGMALDDVGRALGMDADELLRYRQRGGLLDGVCETYSEAWE